MSYPWLVGLSAVKMALGFLFVFVLVPARIFPPRPGATLAERFFENLTLMTCASLLIVQALTLLHVYNSLSLAVAYVLLYLGIRRYRSGQPLVPALKRSAQELTVLAFQSLDGLVDFRAGLRSRLAATTAAARRALADPSRCLHGLLFVAVLGMAIWLRSVDPVGLAPLSFSDSYYHLEALKQLELGQPYWEDLYPKGFHSFMSVLHQVTWIDPVLIAKLSGPLCGVLIVLSVYWATFRLTRDRNSALVAMLVAGIVDGWSSKLFDVLEPERWTQFFGTNTAAPFMLNARQTASLPQEFAMIFVLPAFFLAHAYWTGKSGKRDLALLFAAATIVYMSHWIVSVALTGGLAIMTAVAVLRPAGFLLRLVRAVAACALAGVVGNFQFLGSLLGAASAHADSVQATYASALAGRYAAWLEFWKDPLPVPPVLYAALAAAAFALVYGVLFARGAVQRTAWMFTGFLTLALLFEIRAINFGVLYLIPPDRTGEFLGLVLPVVLGGVWSAVTGFRPGRASAPAVAAVRQIVTALALAGVAVVAVPTSFASAPRYEYPSLAEIYFDISRKFPPLQWTIVSNVEDYSKALTKGWHMNAPDFLDRSNPTDPKVPIPTPYVFLFVEKKPLEITTTYQTRLARQDAERRLGEWVFTRSAFFNDLSLYFEDNFVLVYLLRVGAAG